MKEYSHPAPAIIPPVKITSASAEIERNLISQRTREALAVKRMEGVRLGRPPGSSQKRLTFIKEYDNISALLAQGESVSKIAKKYGIHRNTMRKYLSEMQKNAQKLNFC